MKRLFSLVLCLLLIFVLAVPAFAAHDSGWIELLETATVNDSGSNLITLKKSSDFFSIKTPDHMYATKVDLLLTHADGKAPKFVKVYYNGGYYTLTKQVIDSRTTRFYGDNIPDVLYADLRFEIAQNGSGTVYYQVLSCKITSLANQEFLADAEVYLESYGDSGYYGVPEIIYFFRDSSGYYSDSSPWMARVHVYDWQKFDKLSIWGSATSASIESIRVSVGTTALDYTCNYIDVETGEAFLDGDPASSVTYEFGKYMFNITIDLSGVDRTSAHPLYVYFSGSYDITVLTSFNCQYVNGSLATADTTNAGWKQWANDLFESVDSLPERIAAAIGSMYEPDEDKLDSAADQAQDLAEDRLGAVAQAGSIIDGLAGAFQNQTATQFLTVPVVKLRLADVDWTIGGWQVQVVPDAFKPIVETLKIVIDIVCTLSFLTALRNRFEKLLAGGNA